MSWLLQVQLWRFLLFSYMLYFLHTHNVLTCLWIFHWGSPHFSLPSHSSLPPHFLLSHSFLPPLKEEICHLPLTPVWWMTQWGAPLLTKTIHPAVTLILLLLGQKMGSKEECWSTHEAGDHLMMLPEDVMEVWRDVIHSCSSSFLPPSLSFSPCLYLAGFRACGKHLWDPGHRPLSRLPPCLCPGEFVLFKQHGNSLRQGGGSCIPSLSFLKAPKSHGKG